MIERSQRLNRLTVLTWTLFHGRSCPGSRRSLRLEFTEALSSWQWDVALLQEVPPWWLPSLATTCEAQPFSRLTSRNGFSWARRGLAERWPDLMKSQGGGCNAVLVRRRSARSRGDFRLRIWPERRYLQAVLVEDVLLANVHASAGRPSRAVGDLESAVPEIDRLASDRPVVFGGDFNLRRPSLDDIAGRYGFLPVASRDVDHILARGFKAVGEGGVLDRGALSDHPPLVTSLEPSQK